jgi:hypothetical protein
MFDGLASHQVAFCTCIRLSLHDNTLEIWRRRLEQTSLHVLICWPCTHACTHMHTSFYVQDLELQGWTVASSITRKATIFLLAAMFWFPKILRCFFTVGGLISQLTARPPLVLKLSTNAFSFRRSHIRPQWMNKHNDSFTITLLYYCTILTFQATGVAQ